MKYSSENKLTADNKTVLNTSFIIRFFIFIILVFAFFILSSFKIQNHFKNLLNDTKDTIFVYDTVVYYDTTVVYDTVYIPSDKISFDDSLVKLSGKIRFGKIIMQDSDFLLLRKYKKNKHNKIHLFSLDLLYSPLYSSQHFKSGLLYEPVSNINNKAVNASLGNTVSVNFNFHKKKSVFTSGIDYTNFRINFSSLSAEYLIDTIPKIHLTPETQMIVNTIKLINIDSLIATGDTVYYYITDTTYNTYIDTTYIPEPDTTTNYYNNKAKNSVTYIEIPLFYGRSFYTSNFNITPEAGIITSFFVNSKGKIVSLTDLYQTNNLKNKPKFAAVNLSVYLGINFNYYITEKLDFITTAYFRRNINSIFKDYPLISRFNSMGINFGLRYKFLF